MSNTWFETRRVPASPRSHDPPEQAAEVPRRQRQEGVSAAAVAGTSLVGVKDDLVDRSPRGQGGDSMADLMEHHHEDLERIDGGRFPEEPHCGEVYGETGEEGQFPARG